MNSICSKILTKYGVTKEDLEESFRRLCNNSVFAHENELKNGYIVMKNGSRAGVCGNICESGNFRDVSSINIRIAREVFPKDFLAASSLE